MRILSATPSAILGMVFALSLSSPLFAQNELVLIDDFDDGLLDPAWDITFTGDGAFTTDGWDYEESGTSLISRDITSTPSSAFGWRMIEVSRSIPPVGDFRIEASIAWDSEPPPGHPLSANFAAQVVAFTFADGDGNWLINKVGYVDAWSAGAGGEKQFSSPFGIFQTGPYTVPNAGSAFVEVNRVGNLYEFLWDGVLLFSATGPTTEIEEVILLFRKSATSTPVGGGLMGTLSFDYILVEGELASASSLIANLVDQVMTLNLQMGISNSLDAKLETALNALDDLNEQNDVAAINSLQAFINSVEAQSGNELSEEDARALIAAAQAILDILTST
jgi:hypothetical protein